MNEDWLNIFLSKYYPRLINTGRMMLRFLGARDNSEDIVQDTMLYLCQLPVEVIDEMIHHERQGSPHLFNYLRRHIIHRSKSMKQAARITYELSDRDVLPSDSIPWGNLNEEEYARFREVSCNVRPDDFITPLEPELCVAPRGGWVSGYIHKQGASSSRIYWRYGSWVGDRRKGEKQKKIKSSTSRHKAYMALMEYSNRLLQAERQSKNP